MHPEPDRPRAFGRTADGVTEYRDLTVARFMGYRPLECDLHVPDGEGPHPVVFWIHGGAWREGSRRDRPPAGKTSDLHGRLLARGYAVADVDYRLSSEAVYPAQLHDIRAAIDWVHSIAPRAGLDGKRFALFGDSAGAHLAVLTALAATRGDDPRPAVRAVVDWYGPTDLTFPDGPPAPDDPAIPLFGGLPADVPDIARLGSPVYQVHPQAPPLFCVHGSLDRNVPFGASEALVAAWRAQGVSAELLPAIGAGHCFEGYPDVDTLIERSVGFLDRTLAARPA
ncbi:alpha/beta hydrolase fold domain-containing protein [Kitasatospora sp. NPDC058063]|uniref:alpha/beta hydrolase fold domain-containing protein n=1 Tax=unclassified Kitasatospora TaxID=2633591 RepID=UPI0036DD7D96